MMSRGAALALLLGACRDAPPPMCPCVLVEHNVRPAPRPPLPRRVAAAALLLGTDPRVALSLADALDEAMRDAERRANPLFVALDDERGLGALHTWVALHRPAWDAAESLAARQWESVDGQVRVSVVLRCPADADARRCRPSSSPVPVSPEEPLARFLAWPLGGLVSLRVAPCREGEVAALLRAARLPGVALVFAPAASHPLDTEDRTRLASVASRWLRVVGSNAEGRLAGEVTARWAEDALDVPTWALPLPGVVRVVPTQRAAADPNGLVRRVLAVARHQCPEATAI